MIISIKKRDGRVVPFDPSKIEHAIAHCFMGSGSQKSDETAQELAALVVSQLENDENIPSVPSVEQVQDVVERVLIEKGFVRSAKAYILYRAERSRVREMNTRLMKVFEDIASKDAVDSDIKRENANINGDTAMGSMLKFGSEGAKQFYEMYVLDPRFSAAHHDGDIHIHDLDFYTLTTTCCQIDLLDLFHGGFSTGHGVLREPNDIYSYSALACIAIQANQNDQHGGQSIVNFDYGMAPGVKKTYRKRFRDNLDRALELLGGVEDSADKARAIVDELSEQISLAPNADVDRLVAEKVAELLPDASQDELNKIVSFVREHAEKETDKATYQAMEALIHNLNTMNSRAGAQVPFSSINYGMDTSPEGRMVMRNVMLATEAGLGNGETPIFPIQIFRVKEGVNFNPGDPNYDLFRLAIKTSAKRLFPNFSFIDAPFNLEYYKPGDYNTEVAYMGCRTRVMANTYDPTKAVTCGRGNLSFTSINLPRLGIRANRDIDTFYKELDEEMDLVTRQLLHRFKIQCTKKGRNYPFLMGQGIWIDSDKIGPDDSVAEILKHGTLSIGFIGLAETLKALTGKHHGESEESRKLGLEIITHMRKFCDDKSKETHLNFTLLATPAEGLSGRFVRIDKKKYGIIPGVTDRDYYTNSFHVPVYYPISAFEKLDIEAPYHALTNAGHISYVELDGDTCKNPQAFEAVIRHMKEVGIGYGSVNHPVDRDPVCGFTGVIDDVCPRCGRREGEPVTVERLNELRKKFPGVPVPCDCNH